MYYIFQSILIPVLTVFPIFIEVAFALSQYGEWFVFKVLKLGKKTVIHFLLMSQVIMGFDSLIGGFGRID